MKEQKNFIEEDFSFEKKITEAFGLLVISFSCLLFFCLITYNASDYALFQANLSGLKNIGGTFGFLLSSFFLDYFGFCSYFIDIVFFSWGFSLFYKAKIDDFKIKTVVLLSSITSCSFCFGSAKRYELYFEFPIGGYIGYYTNYIFEGSHLHFPFIILGICIFIFSAVFVIELQNFPLRERMILVISKINIIKKESIEAVERKILSEDINEEENENEIIQKTTKKTELIQNTREIKNQIRRVKKETCYIPPSIKILNANPQENVKKREKNLKMTQKTEQELEKSLKDFGVDAKIVGSNVGPVITMYEIDPKPGTRAVRVIGLADDIARSLKAKSARISLIPGKSSLAIEVPNIERETVFLREILESDEYQKNNFNIPICLGQNIVGDTIVVDLASMPHLLVAGTTGSGKSVGINSMILSIIYKLSPEECKFIMIDPKMLELSVYEGIPHLLAPVVTNPDKAVMALKWVVREMERRYKAMSMMGVRNIFSYNDSILSNKIDESYHDLEYMPNPEDIVNNEYNGTKKMPFIVVVIDEMADLMITAGKMVEASVQRLSQMARAAGIHIIMATQRPSVDVITGVIKANFPTRISYQVTSKIDSRTILGFQGAESLLGKGDMLYMPTGGKTYRIHAPFVSDKEVCDIVSDLKIRYQESADFLQNYDLFAQITDADFSNQDSGTSGLQQSYQANENDEEYLYRSAVAIIIEENRPSISYIQRKLRIGYNKAAIFIERMEKEGIVSSPDPSGKRIVIIKKLKS